MRAISRFLKIDLTPMMNFFRNMTFLAAVVLAPNAGGGAASAQQPLPAMEQLQRLRDDIRRAHEGGDAASYLNKSRMVHAYLNGSPQSLLQLMSAEAFAGKPDEALDSFEQFVRMGQSNEAALSAKPLEAIRVSERYRGLHAAMAANDGSISTANKLFELDDQPLVPEDIDYDAATQLFYITSVLKKMILAVDMHGSARVFATAASGWPMMAVKVDSRHRLLWATEVALDGYIQSPPKDWGKSAIDIYDLATGKLLHRVEGPAHAALGDMTLTADGDAIVSDGEHGGVYRVRRVSRHVERLDAGGFISPQTPIVLPDGLHVMVPDYLRGIGVLDLESKHIAWLAMEGRHALSGIDGLYLFGNALLATQNGTSPERVVRFELDASLTHIASESIIERATPTLGDPTHGVVIGNRFCYIANSGWDALDDHGNINAGKTASPGIIMCADLGKN
jgi:hypothetical protein